MLVWQCIDVLKKIVLASKMLKKLPYLKCENMFMIHSMYCSHHILIVDYGFFTKLIVVLPYL
jgi:hypothetical protein